MQDNTLSLRNASNETMSSGSGEIVDVSQPY